MKYKKEEILDIVKNLLEYYKKSDYMKEIIKASNTLLELVKNSNEEVILSNELLNDILFRENENGTKDIIKDLFYELRGIGADLSGFSFDNVNISGYYFNGLKNVTINIDNIPNKDISKTYLNGVKLLGSLDGANIEQTNFTGYIGSLELDPQKLSNKNLYFTNLSGIKINGSFDDVNVRDMKIENSIGTIKINPQKVKDKDLSSICIKRIEFIGDDKTNNVPCFDECIFFENDFNGIKQDLTIDLSKCRYAYNVNFSKVKLLNIDSISSSNIINCSYTNDDDKIIAIKEIEKEDDDNKSEGLLSTLKKKLFR